MSGGAARAARPVGAGLAAATAARRGGRCRASVILVLLHLAACVPVSADSSATTSEGTAAAFGSASGVCVVGESVYFDVGSAVAVVSGDSCPDNGARCEPMILRRQEPASSEWYGDCANNNEAGWTYSIAWVVPAS